MKIRYADGGAALDVRLIAVWRREVLPGPVMSSSSGPKDYLKNQIWSAFNQVRAVDLIAMVRASGPMFLLLRAGGRWHDVTAREVVGVEVAA